MIHGGRDREFGVVETVVEAMTWVESTLWCARPRRYPSTPGRQEQRPLHRPSTSRLSDWLSNNKKPSPFIPAITPISFPIHPDATLEISHPCSISRKYLRSDTVFPFLQPRKGNVNAICHLHGSLLRRTQAGPILRDLNVLIPRAEGRLDTGSHGSVQRRGEFNARFGTDVRIQDPSEAEGHEAI